MSRPRRKSTVGELHAALDVIAPFSAAAEWDNVGLLAGRMEWPARRVLLAIDLTDAVAAEALAAKADVVIAYHPPIFKGVRNITNRAEAPTRHLPDLLAERVSILSVHTALDAAVGGTNDVLLDAFDIVRRQALQPLFLDSGDYKLIAFVPTDGVERLRAGLAVAGAGNIGHYRECSFELSGHGTFRGDDTTNPTVGRRGTRERVAEVRLEMIVPAAALSDAIRALYANHPYEEPAFDIYPLRTPVDRGQAGMGRIGTLKRPRSGRMILARLRGLVDLSSASIVGSLTRPFSSITTAAGSFGVRAFRDPTSLVITGEMKHHDALELLRRDVTAIAVGHYASERPALERLSRRLVVSLPDARFAVSRKDRAPFRPVAAR